MLDKTTRCAMNIVDSMLSGKKRILLVSANQSDADAVTRRISELLEPLDLPGLVKSDEPNLATIGIHPDRSLYSYGGQGGGLPAHPDDDG